MARTDAETEASSTPTNEGGGTPSSSSISRSFSRVAQTLHPFRSTAETPPPRASPDRPSAIALTDALERRGRSYPPLAQNFDFDPTNPSSHWRRARRQQCPSSSLSGPGGSDDSVGRRDDEHNDNNNVVPYLIAHGLTPERALAESTREYVQRWRLVDYVDPSDLVNPNKPKEEDGASLAAAAGGSSSGGGSVFEVDTDNGRRIEFYHLHGAGWNEDCPDGAVLFGAHTPIFAGSAEEEKDSRRRGGERGGCGHDDDDDAAAAAAAAAANAKRMKYCRIIHRNTTWEDGGTLHVTMTKSPDGTGPLETTDRYLASDYGGEGGNGGGRMSDGKIIPSPFGTAARGEGGTAEDGDGTVMVVERAYVPPSSEEDAVTCREVFVRCYHRMGDAAPSSASSASSSCRCIDDAVAVLASPFEAVPLPLPLSFPSPPHDGGSGSGSGSGVGIVPSGPVKVRTILVPFTPFTGTVDGTDESSGGAAIARAGEEYRVVIEADATDLRTRGLIGLLSDGLGGGDGVTAEDVVRRVDPDRVGHMMGLFGSSPDSGGVADDTEEGRWYGTITTCVTRAVQKQIGELLELR